MGVSVKVSKKGKNVASSDAADIQFDGSKNYALISGPYTQTISITTTIVPGGLSKKEPIYHGKGFKPLVMCFLDFTNADIKYFGTPDWIPIGSEVKIMMLPFYVQFLGLFGLEVDDNYFYIVGNVDEYRNVKMSYYIVENEL